MKVAKLTGLLGVWLCFTACAAERSSEPNAKAADAQSPPASAERDSAAASAAELPAPAPAPPPQGLDAPKSEAARDEAEFSNLEAAERALNQAKADLDRLALAEPSPVLRHEPSTARATEKKQSDSHSRPAGAPAAGKSNTLCEETCRAFSSLSRAASAVCRLDGSTGKHCSHAKQVLADAQQRVASCSCPASSD